MGMRDDFPWLSAVIALVGASGVAIASGQVWLGIATAALWLGTLALSRPPGRDAAPTPSGLQLTQDAMAQLIENRALPLLMLDRNRVLIANEAAREIFGSHVVGQDARIALRHPEAVKLLDLAEGGTATVGGLTGPRSVWQMSRSPVADRYWLVELINRTAEADISRAHTDFVANASHELRTPLANIIGYVETLSEDGPAVDAVTRRRFLDTVLREAQRLQALVSDLMSLSRIEAEKHERPPERIDLRDAVASAAGSAGRSQDRQRVELELDDRPIAIRGDREQIEQLVRDLVDNALKYGAADQPVVVTLRLDRGSRAVLTVSDRGEGIAKEHLPHLTRRFYRTDPGRSRQAGGTGLGLAIVKHIVERHAGRLDIDSTVGQGTTVTVRLPALASAIGGDERIKAGVS